MAQLTGKLWAYSGRKLLVLALWAAALGATVCANTAWATYLPSLKIGVAPLVSPSTADSFYGSGTTSSHTSGLPTDPAPEIVAMARALKNDPDLIYQYVRNNIEVEWAYGLRKGALGAMIDKSGTPFDQAMLMVALLRQAGFTATYEVGTITLDGGQFNAWTNITSAAAACQLLSGGGVPAVINGTTTADCSYGTATVASVQMAHIWVKVHIPGAEAYCPSANCLFDPSYKPYNWLPGIDLAGAMGFTSGTAYTTVTSGMTSGSSDPNFGLPYARSLNNTGLGSIIQGYASSLLSYMTAHSLNGAELEAIISGGTIAPVTTSVRLSTLPYSTSVLHEWTGDIPNQYRTTLQVSGTMGNVNFPTSPPETLFDKTFYVDEIYGRRLTIGTNFTFDQITAPGQYSTFITKLMLDDQVLSSHTMSGSVIPNAHYPAAITITANHPYAANVNGTAGDYMDATLTKDVILVTAVSIVDGWGDTGPELLAKWSGERAQDVAAPGRTDPPPCPGETCVVPAYLSSTGDFTREKAQANFLAQYTRAARMNAAIANGIVQTHHVLGVVYADDYVDDDNAGRIDGSLPDFFVTDSYMRIDVDTGLSFASRTADAATRRAAVQAIAAASAAIEGTMAGQMADAPDTSSTATRFEWGNNPTCDSLTSNYWHCEDPSQAGPRNFFGITSTLPAHWALWESHDDSHIPADGGSLDATGNPQFWAPDEMGALTTFINQYTAAGFSVTASQESFLGPGQRGGYIKVIHDTAHGGHTTYNYAWTKQRGGALIATKYDGNGDPVEIAHVVVGLIAHDASGNLEPVKGGGATTAPSGFVSYNPATAADVLKSRFVDRSNALGVTLSNGSMSYTSPASISVGSGDFPYSLSAGFTFHQGPLANEEYGPIFPGSSAGWVSSWDNALTISGSGMEGMGVSDVRAAAGAIAAFMVLQDLYRHSPTVARDVGAALDQAWLTHQFSGNVISAMVGGNTRQFVRLADGSWIAPGPSYATLSVTTVSGQSDRKPFTYLCNAPGSGTEGANYALSRGWDNSVFTHFIVTSASGDTQDFGYWLNHYNTSVDAPDYCGRASGFRLNSWTFPQGMTVSLSYVDDPGGTSEGTTSDGDKSSSPNYANSYPSGTVLYQVSNGLGRVLTYGLDGSNHVTIADGHSRTLVGPHANFDGTYTTTDPIGAVIGFTFYNQVAASSTARPVPFANLKQVATPYIGTNPGTYDLQYDYDGVGQVSLVHDAVNLQIGDSTVTGGRDPWAFRIADGTRGERDDPTFGHDATNQGFVVVYDTHKHPVRYMDELGRETDSTSDSQGRVTSYTYPLGDKELFEYDDHDNTLKLTKVPYGVGSAPIVINATYDATWNKPLSITNGRGITTTFTYYNSGYGKSLMATAVRPADGYGNGSATYSFTYTSIGKPLTATDPDGVATTNGYDGSGNLTTTEVDPSHLDLTTAYGYDAIGNVTSTTDPRGNVTSSSYDLDRRKLEDDVRVGGAGTDFIAATALVYDALGRVVDKKQAKAVSGTTVTAWVTTHTTYTPTSKPATVTDPDGRTVTTTYDPLDRVDTVTDPVGRAIHNAYDAAGQLITEYRAWGSALQEAYATHAYDFNGKETSVYDALGSTHITHYNYDGLNRMTSTVFADSSHEDVTYDANSNMLTRKTRASDTFKYAYDNLDRLRVKTVPQNGGGSLHTITTAYSLAGRVTSLTDSAGPAISYGFDTAYRAVSETQTTLGTARTVAWQLDANGNHTRLTWPDSYAIDYVYDSLGRMTTATVHGGVLLASYGYDPLSRRTSVSYNSGSSAMGYSYSDAGDLLTLSDDFAGTTNDVTFTDTYTNAHQLATETTSNSAYVAANPGAGSGDTYGSVNALNQYPSVNGGAYSWDADGNLSAIPNFAYVHDAENRLSRARGTGSSLLNVSYTYDPLGRRMASQVDPHTAAQWGTAAWGSLTWAAIPATVFLHDGDNEIAEYDDTGSLIRRFIPGAVIDDPVAMVTAAGATTFFHKDRKGSIVAMADTSGARVEGPYTYDAYGNCFVGSTTTSCTTLPSTTEPFRYTGQRYDAETGLMYYRARYYAPGIGRFVETDPVGYKPDVNWYSYVGNDPTDRSDSNGRDDLDPNLALPLMQTLGGVSPAGAKQFESGLRQGMIQGAAGLTGAGITAAAVYSNPQKALTGAVVNLVGADFAAKASGQPLSLGDQVVAAATGAVGGAAPPGVVSQTVVAATANVLGQATLTGRVDSTSFYAAVASTAAVEVASGSMVDQLPGAAQAAGNILKATAQPLLETRLKGDVGGSGGSKKPACTGDPKKCPK